VGIVGVQYHWQPPVQLLQNNCLQVLICLLQRCCHPCVFTEAGVLQQGIVIL
jgi:hypothetical protein